MVTVCIAILSASVSTKEMKNANGHYCFQNVAKPIRDHCCQKTTPDVHQQPRNPVLQDPPGTLASLLFDVDSRQLEHFVGGFPAFEINEPLRQRGDVQNPG